jgi:hypothetical protein
MRLIYFIALVLPLGLLSCQNRSAQKPALTDSLPTNSEGNMVIDLVKAEEPRGEKIHTWKEENNYDVSSWWMENGDSLMIYICTSDSAEQNKYWDVFVSGVPLSAINPSEVYAFDGEFDNDDGSKFHQYSVFIKSKEEKDLFAGRTYCCMNYCQNTPYTKQMHNTISIRTKSMDDAKKLEAKIKSLLK